MRLQSSDFYCIRLNQAWFSVIDVIPREFLKGSILNYQFMFVPKPTSVKRAFGKKKLRCLFRVQKREDDIILRGCASHETLADIHSVN